MAHATPGGGGHDAGGVRLSEHVTGEHRSGWAELL